MLTKPDKNWLKNNFITNEDAKNFASPSDLKALEDRIDKRLDEKLDEKIKFLPTKDDFYEKMDQVMGELKTVRESQELHAGQHAEIRDEIDKLKKAVNSTN
ncbi:hypothetical protein A2773_06770 [Candidatus Gottesmanbacteria bacterium RIFCSPHIGHO2_01_FULL_39_10]|uniref:Uncharacterized protein n=1 Tax=Candidatus Gottesmanbacteria bacterium RIFCSPHIGHO2_01_FULL_39_10 TaxID=1798375 RepID=A0A1F5ZQA1_9BACT|nr:MAG: hypothetical protein A2773_06770 [Candidatus Gottesmanbacteria bacterium RIFCSPHIGHO2_01_FULL_39_10]